MLRKLFSSTPHTDRPPSSPTEIPRFTRAIVLQLAHILITDYTEDPDTWVEACNNLRALSQICPQWRNWTINCPSIWGHAVEADRSGRGWLDLVLSRAANSALHVCFCFQFQRQSDTTDNESQAKRRLLLGYQRQYHSLRIDSLKCWILEGPMPEVRICTISVRTNKLFKGSNLEDRPIHFGSIQGSLQQEMENICKALPNLTQLQVSDMTFIAKKDPNYDYERTTFSVGVWYGILAALPALQSLCLRGCIHPLPSPPLSPGNVSLERLESLELHGDFAVVSEFTSGLRAPSLRQYSVHVGQEWGLHGPNQLVTYIANTISPLPRDSPPMNFGTWYASEGESRVSLFGATASRHHSLAFSFWHHAFSEDLRPPPSVASLMSVVVSSSWPAFWFTQAVTLILDCDLGNQPTAFTIILLSMPVLSSLFLLDAQHLVKLATHLKRNPTSLPRLHTIHLPSASFYDRETHQQLRSLLTAASGMRTWSIVFKIPGEFGAIERLTSKEIPAALQLSNVTVFSFRHGSLQS
jgi:hypothetical protein